ncbi:MAG: solute-binding protein, partial [Tissierellia bacterium]|nr:solute-binding protein [Tissierellia bacterium]
MKKTQVLVLALLLIFSVMGCAKEEVIEEKVLRLTTTTSVNDSGLMDSLMGPLKEDTGMSVEIVSKGSGAAIEDGRIGNADVILVHSPAAEKEFVEEGFGVERKTFMHNYFVIVGPKDDPAGIKGLSAEEAFKAIIESGELFVSRGDESGTHKKEENIWKSAGFEMDAIVGKGNYNALGDGMGATLTFSSEKGGYTLTDLSTFLSMESDLALDVLVDESDTLKNEYSLILVNPDKVKGTNPELAK